jgi:hypothetical protein
VLQSHAGGDVTRTRLIGVESEERSG